MRSRSGTQRLSTLATAPIRLAEVEIGAPLSNLQLMDDGSTTRYFRARLLVRLHGVPLGITDVDVPTGELEATSVAEAIWHALGAAINQHLRGDDLPALTALPTSGLIPPCPPECRRLRTDFVEKAPHVTVVVPTRDRPRQVEGCLRSLLALEYPNFEIVVVDNGSTTTATDDLIATQFAEEPRLRYVREIRGGVSLARNRGLAEARSPIVAFCDDDVLHDPQWLTELVRGFSAADDVGAVSGSILPTALDTPSEIWLEQYGGFHKGFVLSIFDMAENRPGDPLYPYTAGTFGSGASLAFRTEALRSIGGYDEALGAGTTARGGEDLAALFDIVTSGRRVVYAPTAIVYHSHYREYAHLRKQLYGYGIGLTAFLTRVIVDRPSRVFDFLRLIPMGLYFALSPRSRKNARKQAGYPRDLTLGELFGMIRGPEAYLRSLVALRATRQAR